MTGFPVIIVDSGGIPVRAVEANGAPATLSTNGLGVPVTLADHGAPLVIEGYSPNAPLATPTGFRWTDHPTIYADYTTDLDIGTLRPAPTVTYYVNPVGGQGNDSNDGLTPATALLNLSTALAKVDVDEVQFVATGDVICRGARGWNNVNVTRSVNVRNLTGHRIILAAASSTVPTWTAHATLPNVYQRAVATAPEQMVDTIASRRRAPVNPATSAPINTVPTMFETLLRVSDVNAVAATPGTWSHDGTNQYIQMGDGRAPDAWLVTAVVAANGRAGGTDATTVFLENIDFVGSTGCFNFWTTSALHTGNLYQKGCTFQASRNVSNGLSIIGKIDVRSVNCATYYCGADGFNYHGFDATPDTSPTFLELGCVSEGCGTLGSVGTSDNASTAHEYATGIRLNCVYVNADDRVLADINNAQSWVLNTAPGPADGTTDEDATVVLLDSAEMWMDGCTILANAAPQYIGASGTTLHYRNMPAPVNAGAGAVEAY